MKIKLYIYIAIEHINGEICGVPFIIEENEIEKYWLEGYLIYKLYLNKKLIEEINL